MGVDLRLLPFDCGMSGNEYSHTILSCERDYTLFDEIQLIEKQRARVVPPSFSTFVSRDGAYEEPHYGNTQETPYGDPLREVEVEDLLKVKHYATRGVNNAIWAYLANLLPRTRVALYWH